RMRNVVVAIAGYTSRLAVAGTQIRADDGKSFECRLISTWSDQYVLCESVPREYPSRVADAVIEAAVILIHIVGKRIHPQIIVRRRQPGRRPRKGSSIQNFPCDWMDSVCWNHIAWKCRANAVLGIA